MSKLETLHGDEAAIEHAADEFFPVLDPHMRDDTGELDLEAAAEGVGQVEQRLALEFMYGEQTIALGLRYAAELVKDKRELMQYM